jgi:DNA-binding HxlR family transcriptional regulator
MAVEAFDTRPRLRLRDGWVSRHYKPTVPPQVTYAITKRVLELDGVMTELDRIAERWYGKSGKGI